jgi:hypothetical protein
MKTVHNAVAAMVCSWIRAKERALGLLVVRASDPGLLRQVEAAVQLGQPLLIEGMADGSLPGGMDALLLRQVEKQGACGCLVSKIAVLVLYV